MDAYQQSLKIQTPNQEMSMQVQQELDARGLSCPLPILKTKKTLANMAPGEVLKLTTTDHGSLMDVKAFCGMTGHELLSTAEGDGLYVFLIRKG
jgi:tRNA 2-thiouridine synthesizing protein A